MLFIYPAIFHKENDNYWVEFPDLEGCNTFGDTLSEVMEFAQEAMEVYIETLLESRKELPSPTEISDIITEEGSFVSLVTCKIDGYLNKSKAIKKTLTIPEWLNDLAEEKKINFSQTLQSALLERLNISK